jgi:PAS domain-containing protein
LYRNLPGAKQAQRFGIPNDRIHFGYSLASEAGFRAGQAIGSGVTFLEISQRRSFERAIRDSEQKFRAIFGGAELGIAVAEIKSGQITANPAYGQMLGCTAEGMSFISIFDELTQPDDVERDIKVYQPLATGEIDHLDIER